MRFRPRLDANQQAIVKELLRLGCSVQSLASVGGGAPDLLVGYRGVSYLIELKDGDKPPSARKLTPKEADWHAKWKGQVAIAENINDVVKAIGLEEKT